MLVVAVRYTGSPVGPYLELAVGEPARLGTRLGWCMTTMVVDDAASRVAGRAAWGFPKELGTLVWDRDGEVRSLRWVERGVEVRGVPARWRLPVLVPVRALQRRTDGPVIVPGRLRGVARPARVEVEVGGADDPLAPLAGPRRRRRIDRRSANVWPPQMPSGSRTRSAYSRHGSRTEQLAQTSFAGPASESDTG